jgi:hypothetical protein
MDRGFFCFGAFLIFIQEAGKLEVGSPKSKSRNLNIPPRIVYDYRIPDSRGYSLFNICISAMIHVKAKFYQN